MKGIPIDYIPIALMIAKRLRVVGRADAAERFETLAVEAVNREIERSKLITNVREEAK